MATAPRNPALLEINTRVWLNELGATGRPAGSDAVIGLDLVPDEALDRIAAEGFDWVWLLGVWQPGETSGRIVRSLPDLMAELQGVLPDLRDEDIAGSCFAIRGYEVDPLIGGEAALRRLRERLAARGLRLMLDFIPNHVALDHPWAAAHADWFVRGSEADLQRMPSEWCRLPNANGGGIFAHGRDPHLPPWTDTLQLNYGSAGLQAAMRGELQRIAALCDGVRCDMAMLILPEVFHHTWGIAAEPFWPQAIAAVRQEHPGFCMLAEVYGGLESALLAQGFDYAYDKELYDRLREGNAGAVRAHLRAASSEMRDKLVHFLENHDEARAAHIFPHDRHQAAALITFVAAPGLRFFHHGQLHGRRVRVPVQLSRGPMEPEDEDIASFYRQLLGVLRLPVLRGGHWSHLEPQAAWPGNESWDGFVACAWHGGQGERLVCAVNYTPADAQCHLRLPFPELVGHQVTLRDLLSAEQSSRKGSELVSPGLYLELPAWGWRVMALDPA